jgi:RNA polymerase sigma factor (TIGR02999 family)
MSEVTRILNAIEQGDARSTEQLLPLVYQELRRLAAHKMAQEPAGHTLQATALVHEAWLKLVDSRSQSWQNRAHFFGAAAEAMRRILIARARRKSRQRRGAGALHLAVEDLEIASPAPDDQLLALNDALDRFAALEPQPAELVKLRYFVGLKIEEAAEVLGISRATATRWWAYARAWLYEAIHDGTGGKTADLRGLGSRCPVPHAESVRDCASRSAPPVSDERTLRARNHKCPRP